MVIPHLLFVDDTLIFCKDNVFQLRFLRRIFFCFKVEDQYVQIGIVQWVQFRMLRSWTVTLVVMFLLFPLGLPLGAPLKAKHIWDSLLERMQKILDGSKKKLQNSKGILCWGGGGGGGRGDEFKFHLVNYKSFYAPISNCGLGIKNLLLFNKVLLGKWLWQYEGEHNAL